MVEWLSEVGGDGGASGGGGASGRWVERLRGDGVVERRWSGWRRVRWVCEAGGPGGLGQVVLWVSVVSGASVVLGGMNDKKPEPA